MSLFCLKIMFRILTSLNLLVIMTICGDLSDLSLFSQACSKNSLLIIVNMIFWSKYVICSATSNADRVEMFSLLGT